MNPQVWTFRTIDEDAFIARFGPRPNHLDLNASFDFGNGGCLFAVTEPELTFVKSQDRQRVWTVLDGDEGCIVIESGLHYVNRLGFIVTTEPVEDRVTYTVPLE
jgi:hypothetical protein